MKDHRNSSGTARKRRWRCGHQSQGRLGSGAFREANFRRKFRFYLARSVVRSSVQRQQVENQEVQRTVCSSSQSVQFLACSFRPFGRHRSFSDCSQRVWRSNCATNSTRVAQFWVHSARVTQFWVQRLSRKPRTSTAPKVKTDSTCKMPRECWRKRRSEPNSVDKSGKISAASAPSGSTYWNTKALSPKVSAWRDAHLCGMRGEKRVPRIYHAKRQHGQGTPTRTSCDMPIVRRG